MGGLSGLLDKMPLELQQAAAKVRWRRRKAGGPHGRHHQFDDPAGRRKPDLIKASRKRRIATGAGVHVQEVNRLLNQFEADQTMMKKFSQGGMGKLMRGLGGLHRHEGQFPGLRW